MKIPFRNTNAVDKIMPVTSSRSKKKNIGEEGNKEKTGTEEEQVTLHLNFYLSSGPNWVED